MHRSLKASLEPHRESPESLRNLFNIHSSGAPGTIVYQIQTFRALCDYAAFDGAGVQAPPTIPVGVGTGGTPAALASPVPEESFGIHIDLHIHLPENRTGREYQYIIQDIAHFIYGREQAAVWDAEVRS